jgi:hypothetical protein
MPALMHMHAPTECNTISVHALMHMHAPTDCNTISAGPRQAQWPEPRPAPERFQGLKPSEQGDRGLEGGRKKKKDVDMAAAVVVPLLLLTLGALGGFVIWFWKKSSFREGGRKNASVAPPADVCLELYLNHLNLLPSG